MRDQSDSERKYLSKAPGPRRIARCWYLHQIVFQISEYSNLTDAQVRSCFISDLDSRQTAFHGMYVSVHLLHPHPGVPGTGGAVVLMHFWVAKIPARIPDAR